MTKIAAMLPRKNRFHLPADIVYLDGNSLGPLPVGVTDAAMRTMRGEWGNELIRGWNSAGWMDLPRVVGNRIAPIIGVAEGTVAMGDTLSIKIYQALAEALRMRPGRRTVLSDTGDFDAALEAMENARRLNPRGTGAYRALEGRVLFHLRRFYEGLAKLESAVLRDPAIEWLHLSLAATYVAMGRPDDAAWSVDEARTLNPSITLASLRKHSPYRQGKHLDEYLDALRMAGVPD